MDRDDLRTATETWVKEGIISPEQADEILDHHEEPDDGLSRTVVALSLMGATLFGIGAAMLLALNWESIPRWLATIIVVAAPLSFGSLGVWLRDGRAPRVGHALWLLAAGFVGPSIILLIDMWPIEIAEEWILLAWATVALPAGHGGRSRPTTALGLIVITALVVMLSSPPNVLVGTGLFGTILLAIGLVYHRSATDIGSYGTVYRFLGAGTVIASLFASVIGLSSAETITATPLLAIEGLAAVSTVGLVAWYVRSDVLEPSALLWLGVTVTAVVIDGVLTTASPELREMVGVLIVHAALLAVLITTVSAAMGLQSTSLVNLVVIAFLGQVLVFLSTTLPAALPTEIVLLVTGLVMLATGLAIERGRRQLLERIGTATR